MDSREKEAYAEPVLVAHELLRDLTGVTSSVKTSDKTIDALP